MDAVQTAENIFADHGITKDQLGELLDSRPSVFEQGGECHAVIFERGYLHFHSGRGVWEEFLADDDPDVRIREMTFNGKPVGESGWFSC